MTNIFKYLVLIFLILVQRAVAVTHVPMLLLGDKETENRFQITEKDSGRKFFKLLEMYFLFHKFCSKT